MREHRYAQLAEKVTEPDMSGLSDVETFEGATLRIVYCALAIMKRKRLQRGTANITEQGMSGVLSRLASDKGARLRLAARRIYGWEMALDEGHPVGEILSTEDVNGLVDDLLDTINYSIIALALLYGTWETEADRETQAT